MEFLGGGTDGRNRLAVGVGSISRVISRRAGRQRALSSAMAYTSTRGASVLVDLDRLHHAHLLVVHHMAVHHEDAGVVEEARADDGAAAFGRPRHDHGIAPRPIGLRLTADLDDLERVVWMWNTWSSRISVLRIVHASTAPRRTRWSMREGSKVLPSIINMNSGHRPPG